ncbi:DUF1127 domain-containing protein [Pelagibius sp.]|uniref:DUF1127 domain-containing protein n=1 Tax=Pelagibius sp. TaxID=1931238 RepID=UPI0026113BC9|nr:DUF1127 domain-containing protein [Pelagibius sp.]
MSNAVTKGAALLPSSPKVTHGGLLKALLRAPVLLLDLMIDWQLRAEERASLTQLNDHQLRDVGLTAEDMRAMAAKPHWSR